MYIYIYIYIYINVNNASRYKHIIYDKSQDKIL